MSTTAMWLLLAVVVIVIVFASVLYKRTFTVHELALTGVMAALSLVAYLFFRVPFYGGSSFHLGNTFTAPDRPAAGRRIRRSGRRHRSGSGRHPGR